MRLASGRQTCWKAKPAHVDRRQRTIDTGRVFWCYSTLHMRAIEHLLALVGAHRPIRAPRPERPCTYGGGAQRVATAASMRPSGSRAASEDVQIDTGRVR